MRSLLAGVSILLLSAWIITAVAQETQTLPAPPMEPVPREELIDPQDLSLTEQGPPERISMSRACVVTASLRMRSGISFRVNSRDGQTKGYLIPHRDGIRYINDSGTSPGDMSGIIRIQPQEAPSANVQVLFDAFRQRKAIHIVAINPEKPQRSWVYDVQSIFLTYADCE